MTITKPHLKHTTILKNQNPKQNRIGFSKNSSVIYMEAFGLESIQRYIVSHLLILIFARTKLSTFLSHTFVIL